MQFNAQPFCIKSKIQNATSADAGSLLLARSDVVLIKLSKVFRSRMMPPREY